MFVDKLEQKVLKRVDAEVTSLTGYAGSQRTGDKHTACYHNPDNFSDYGLLGDAEVVQVDVPTHALENAFLTFFSSFVELDKDQWERPDYFNQGAEYRSLIGIPGGMQNTKIFQILQKANLHNMSLRDGQGSDPDTFMQNAVYVMDSIKFVFIQAEPCLQFHDDQTVKYTAAYHAIKAQQEKNGRIGGTKCPANYVCASASAGNASNVVSQAASKESPAGMTKVSKAPWVGLGKGRTCPAWPEKASNCPLKNITDKFGEFEPVCVLHFPQIGGEFAEFQGRRCMPGEKAPYFKDSEGVFRCACCGAPLWKPSQQFDQVPASQWPWPSFHSPPLNDEDGLPSVCHRGEPTPGVVDRNATIDLGLGAKGEVGCARCGTHLGDYFDSDEMGHDHYCINGVCMTPPGGSPGTTCAPTNTAIVV